MFVVHIDIRHNLVWNHNFWNSCNSWSLLFWGNLFFTHSYCCLFPNQVVLWEIIHTIQQANGTFTCDYISSYVPVSFLLIVVITMFNIDTCTWNQRLPAESYIIRRSGNSSQKTRWTSNAITGRDVHKYCMNKQSSSSKQNDSNVTGGCHSSRPRPQGYLPGKCLPQSAGWGSQWLRGRKRGCLEWLDRPY